MIRELAINKNPKLNSSVLTFSLRHPFSSPKFFNHVQDNGTYVQGLCLATYVACLKGLEMNLFGYEISLNNNKAIESRF